MKSKGFTLLEITVVVSIIIFLSAISVANFRGGEKQFALQRSAHKLSQDLRTVQEMAMSSQRFEGSFPHGGYGLHFDIGNNSYILFADCDDDGQYDQTGAALSCSDAFTNQQGYQEKIKEFSLEERISISDLSPKTGNSLNVTYFPPDPVVKINGDPGLTVGFITLTFGGEFTKTVKIYATGLIDIE